MAMSTGDDDTVTLSHWSTLRISPRDTYVFAASSGVRPDDSAASQCIPLPAALDHEVSNA